MSLQATIVVRRPEHTTSLELAAQPGEVVGLIGPNGAGKSTTLQALAGLVSLSEGRIAMAGETWDDGRNRLPTHLRKLGYVFQDHLLFPHLSALDNVAFGLRSRGRTRRDASREASRWLEGLGVADLARRRPRQLSGGQSQRVAIARALAGDPDLLLLDEPTASLDAGGAMSLRARLREHLDAFSGVCVIVTHTALDAMMLSDRLVVLDGGQIVQEGAPHDVAAHPRTTHVAALVGLNLVSGEATRGTLVTPSGASVAAASHLDGPAFGAFSPSAVSLFAERPSGSPRNVWGGRVTSLAPHGDAVRVQLDSDPTLIADVTPAAMATLAIEPGSMLWASVKATEVVLYSA
ncbi:MAG TPA: ABC transporter ATP-binding protein [Nocardioidaceae bacterium]|nr:ABC transporter ATP-binding protein [Nocardioidaceae bacterium]